MATTAEESLVLYPPAFMKNEVNINDSFAADSDQAKTEINASINSLEGEAPLQPRKGTKRVRGDKGKERSGKIPACNSTPGKRSSIYRGVTRHRWTGRYEAHLWDKSTWNPTQKKKGKQVYLGAYDVEEAAARAYDLAALKYWGPTTLMNFPVTDYAKDLEEMQTVSREEFLASLRRKSSGFSRGVSKYRGVARHHHNGRWEARIGRVFGNKYLYLGTYSTQEEAAAAYDLAAIEYRGINAVTNFDLSRYIRWLRPGQMARDAPQENEPSKHPFEGTHHQHMFEQSRVLNEHGSSHTWPSPQTEAIHELPSQGMGYLPTHNSTSQKPSPSPTALSLLLQSSMFKQMLEKVTVDHHEVVETEYGTLGCNDLFDGQHMVDDLQAEITLHENHHDSYGDTEIICHADSIYKALEEPCPPEFPLYSTNPHGSMFFGAGNDQESSLESGLSLWSAFGPSINPLSFTNACLETC